MTCWCNPLATQKQADAGVTNILHTHLGDALASIDSDGNFAEQCMYDQENEDLGSYSNSDWQDDYDDSDDKIFSAYHL